LQEPKLERQQAVQELLYGLKGLEPLKKLFWSELNYDRVNQPLSRRGWKEGVAGLLADDPVLFASGADAFHVIYARLASNKLQIGDERPVVSRLLQEHPYALFVFSNSRQENFHFLNVKYDDDAQKRRLFRRITVGPYEQLRTASERIRLWLSLAVDFDGAKPEPLPNLDYKVEAGDSLLGPSPSGGLEMDFRKPLIEDFLVLKSEFLTAHHSLKKELKEKIYKLRKDIASFGGHTKSAGFDWVVEYAEVFISKGFDVVLANPPYVRADAQFKNLEAKAREDAIAKWKLYRQELVRSDEFETLKEKWDLYIPFLERTFQMLKPCGMMAYIIPDAYNSNKYSEASHDLFLREATIHRIDFCSGVNIFNAGVHNTILFIRKQVGPDSIPMRVLHSAPDVEQFLNERQELTSRSQLEMGEALFNFIAFFQAGFQKLKNDPEANHKILMLRNSFSLKG
jgi:hypothetical protein